MGCKTNTLDRGPIIHGIDDQLMGCRANKLHRGPINGMYSRANSLGRGKSYDHLNRGVGRTYRKHILVLNSIGTYAVYYI